MARMRADRYLLGVVWLVAVVASTLLTLGPMASDAIVEASLQRRLADAAPTEAGIEVRGSIRTEELGAAERVLTDFAAETDAPAMAIVEGGALTFDGRPDLPENVITNLAAVGGLSDLVEWTSGGPPEADTVALHTDAANRLGLAAGDVIELRDGANPVRLVLGGIFRPIDDLDSIWWDDPLVRDGVVPGESFVTVGPLVGTPDLLAASESSVIGRWRLLPDPTLVRLGSLDELRRQPGALTAALVDSGLVDPGRTESGLTALLNGVERSLRSTRVVVIALLALLAALALVALTTAGGMLVESRQVETALLASRGTGVRQLTAAAGIEALIVVGVSAAVAIPLARALLRVVTRIGPGSLTDLSLQPRVTWVVVLVVLAAAGLCMAVLAAPVLRVGDFTAARARRARDEGASWLRASGLDLVVIGLAILGLWQVRRSGAGFDRTGSLGVDPVIVVAPTLALLAGALLSLRLTRWVAGLVALGADRSSALVAPLVTRTIARRPRRTARSVLLVLLAVSISGFALIHGATWEQSQTDQADAEVGADGRVEIDRSANRFPPHLLASGYGAVDGIVASTPAVRDRGSVGGTEADVLLVDPATLTSLQRQRPDLSGDLGDALTSVVDAAPSGREIVGGEQLLVDARAVSTSDPATEGGVEIAAVLIDADGQTVVLNAGRIDVGGPSQTLALPLMATDDSLGPLTIQFPARLLGLRVVMPAGTRTRAGDPPETIITETSIALELSNWRVDDRPLAVAFDDIPGRPGSVAQPLQPASFALESSATTATAQMTGGTSLSSGTRAHFVVPVDATVPGPVPIVVTESLLAELRLSVGAAVQFRVGRIDVNAVVAATVPRVPSYPRSAAAVIADLGRVGALAFHLEQLSPAVNEFLLQTDGADVTAALERAPFRSVAVHDRFDRAVAIGRDPVQLGVVTALTLGVFAAAAAGLVGLIANAVVESRARADDDALLHALGAPQRLLRRILLVEAVGVVGVALALGLTVAVVLGELVVPTLSVDEAGRSVVPEPTVVVPVATLAAVSVLAAVAVLAIPLVVARTLRRRDAPSVLRSGGGR